MTLVPRIYMDVLEVEEIFIEIIERMEKEKCSYVVTENGEPFAQIDPHIEG